MRRRAILAAAGCVVAFGFAGVACSDSQDDSGATTNLEEVGPQVAKLRLEVQQLRQEVQSLREEVALLTPVTDPETGVPLESTTTAGTSATTLPAG